MKLGGKPGTSGWLETEVMWDGVMGDAQVDSSQMAVEELWVLGTRKENWVLSVSFRTGVESAGCLSLEMGGIIGNIVF
jgi:hypothetical protein